MYTSNRPQTMADGEATAHVKGKGTDNCNCYLLNNDSTTTQNPVGLRLSRLTPHVPVFCASRVTTLSDQSPMPIEQALLVVGLSLIISLASEFISWLLVYRTSNYLRVRDELDRNSKRLEQFKQGGNKKDNEKKGKKLEESVKNSARDYQAVKMKANMVTGAVNLLVLNRLLAAFEGTPGGCPLHPASQ